MVCDGKKFECVPLVKKWTAPECKNERVIGNIQHFGNKCIHNYRSTPGRIMFTVECANGECHVTCNTKGQVYRCKGPCGDPARPPSGNSCLRQTCKHYLMRLIEYADKLSPSYILVHKFSPLMGQKILIIIAIAARECKFCTIVIPSNFK